MDERDLRWFGAPCGRPTTTYHRAADDLHQRRQREACDQPVGLAVGGIARLAEMYRPPAEEAIVELLEWELVAEVLPDPYAPRPLGRPAKRYPCVEVAEEVPLGPGRTRRT